MRQIKRKWRKMKWNKFCQWCKKQLLRLKKPFLIVGFVWLVSCITGFVLNCLFTYGFKLRLDINLLVDGKTYLYAFLLFVVALTVVLAYYYKHYWLKRAKKIIQGDERDNDINVNLEAAHFQTNEKVDANYIKIRYTELKESHLVGIPIRAVESKGNYEINFAKKRAYNDHRHDGVGQDNHLYQSHNTNSVAERCKTVHAHI